MENARAISAPVDKVHGFDIDVLYGNWFIFMYESTVFTANGFRLVVGCLSDQGPIGGGRILCSRPIASHQSLVSLGCCQIVMTANMRRSLMLRF